MGATPSKLPHHATRAERATRSRLLVAARALYVYESPPSLPRAPFIRAPVADLPAERPKFIWALRLQLARWRGDLNFGPPGLRALALTLKAVLRALLGTVEPRTMVMGGREGAAKRVADSVAHVPGEDALEPYRALFTSMPLPAIADVFMNDDVFCRLRVAGFNPFSLYAVTSTDTLPFALDPSLLLGGESLDALIRDRRIFAQDFSFLAALSQETKPHKQTAVAKAVYFIPRAASRGDLSVVAIAVDGAIATPPPLPEKTPGPWTLAKLALNVCDVLHHQLIAHLANTHLMLEPFIAATMRQLPPVHPLHALLRQHFEGTAFINENATTELIVPGGAVDRLLAGDIHSATDYVTNHVLHIRFNSNMPDVELQARGLSDSAIYMPYRDDALAHLAAMHDWVDAYLRAFYKTDDDVARDTELHAWAAELVDPAQGHVVEFGDKGDGKIRTVAYLVRAVTNVIFKSSVQHAAVNFPQANIMLFPPHTPGFLASDLPPEWKSLAEKDSGLWKRLLTPIETAVEHISVFSVLGGVYHTKLGRYRRRALPKVPEVQKALKMYQKRLEIIEKDIAEREKDETLKYEFCKPSNIPQSTNV